MSTAQLRDALFAGWPLAECRAICVPTELAPQVWPHVWAMLKKAIDRTDLGAFKELEDGVFEGRSLLWLAWREPDVLAAVVTQLRVTENSRVCLLCACGGSRMEAWLPLMEVIEEYARAMGCNKIRAFGRKGWLRVLPEFHAPFVVLEKDLG